MVGGNNDSMAEFGFRRNSAKVATKVRFLLESQNKNNMEERGLFNSKSPDGGGCFALIVLVFILYTLYNSKDIINSIDTYFNK